MKHADRAIPALRQAYLRDTERTLQQNPPRETTNGANDAKKEDQETQIA
jgi:hypothetical protein